MPPSTTPETGAGGISVSGNRGAPVDLWDTNWPEGGYYWTVVPVEAVNPSPLATTAFESAAIGALQVSIADPDGFSTGDVVDIGNPSNKETVTVTGVTGNTISLATALKQAHGTGEPVLRMSGNLIYRDLELPQEVCASGRVMRFGKSSEPTLVTGGAPFASGLSPKGRLISAAGVGASFYGTAARRVDSGARCRCLPRAVEQEALPVHRGALQRHGRLSDALDLRRPSAEARHLVVPRARDQLAAAAERAVHVVVGPDAHRRGAADVHRQAVATALS